MTSVRSLYITIGNCGASAKTVEPDQGVSWQVSWHIQAGKLSEIALIHAKTKSAAGMTDGYCCECGWVWPCRTYHIAVGWNPEEDDENWCPHAGVRL